MPQLISFTKSATSPQYINHSPHILKQKMYVQDEVFHSCMDKEMW